MDEDERKRKLQAGRAKLMKFQKKKSPDKKKKKKNVKNNDNEPATESITSNGDTFCDADSIASTDLSVVSDTMSIESDQRSISTDDLSLDEADQLQVEYEVAKAELGEAKGRILQLEETLLGKEALVQQLQVEVNEFKQNSKGTDEGEFSSQKEAEYKAVIEQYNSKIYEFQQAIAQRDEIIQQLSVNLQSTIQSRDSLQAEAGQLSSHIHALQQQLQNVGETIKVQNGEQSASAHDMSEAQMQVISLQETVSQKESLLQDLANKYAKKNEELADVKEERDHIKQRSDEEVSDLNKRLQRAEKAITVSPADIGEQVAALHAELDETYGQQIVMIKSQLQERHQNEMQELQQRCEELKCKLEDAVDSNLIKEQLEQQVNELQDQLENKQLDLEALENIQKDFEDQIVELNNQNKELSDKSEKEVSNKTSQLRQKLEEANTTIQELKAELEEKAQTINEEKERLEKEFDTRFEDECAHQDDIHLIALKQQRSEVAVEYDRKMKTKVEELEEHFKMQVLTSKSDKEKEFVQELQNIRQQLAETHAEEIEALKKKITDELNEKHKIDLEEETQKLLKRLNDNKILDENRASSEKNQKKDWIENQGKDWKKAEQSPDWAAKQQREMDDLLEARDALMLQLEDAHRQIENLQSELVSVMDEKEMKDQIDDEVDTPEIIGLDQENIISLVGFFEHCEEENTEISNDETNNKLKLLNDELKMLKEENDQLVEKKKELEEQINNFKFELQKVKEKCENLQTTNEHLKEEVGSLSNEIQPLTEENNHLKTESFKLEDQLHTLNNELIIAKDDHGSSKKGLLEQVDRLMQTMEENAKENSEMKESRDDLLKEIETLKANFNDGKIVTPTNEELVESSVSPDQQNVVEASSVTSSDEDISIEREQLLKDKEQLQHDLESREKEFEAKIMSLEDSSQALSDIVSNLKEEQNDLLQQIKAKDVEIEQLTEVRQAQALRMSKFHDELDDYKEKVDLLAKEKHKEMEEYSNKKKDYENDISNLQEQLNNLKSDMEQLEQQKSEIQSNLMEQLEEKNNNCVSLQSQFEEMRNERNQVESELEEKLHILEIQKEEMNKSMSEQIENLAFACKELEDKLEVEKQQYESKLEMYQSGGLDDNGRKSPEMSVAEKQNAILRNTLQQQGDEQVSVASELVQLKQDYQMLKTNFGIKEAEAEAVREQLDIAEKERKHAVKEWEIVENEVSFLKKQLDEKLRNVKILEEENSELSEQLKMQNVAEKDLEMERDQLLEMMKEEETNKSTNDDRLLLFEKNNDSLLKQVDNLKKDLKETEDIYQKENALLKEALEMEKEINKNHDTLHQEVSDLKDKLAKKEQNEYEILTEKNKQISILQESRGQLEEANEELAKELQSLKQEKNISDVVTTDVQEVFGQQILDLQQQQASLIDQLEDQKLQRGNVSQVLDDQLVREEALKREKDMLLEKLAEKETVEDQLLRERLQLQRQIHEQQQLEDLLSEKDLLEQELSKQKRSLECELREIEGKLHEREDDLLSEKLQLEKELKNKDLQLRRWEVDLKERQLEFRNQQNKMQERHQNEFSSLKTDLHQQNLQRLEKMRSDVERHHAEAINRLKMDMDEEYNARETKISDRHLADISLLKIKHQSQLVELKLSYEDQITCLRKEFEEEKKKQVTTVKAVHERERDRELDEWETEHEVAMQHLRDQLDSYHQVIFDEAKQKMEAAFEIEKVEIESIRQNTIKIELEKMSALLEGQHQNKMDVMQAENERAQTTAIAELAQQLNDAHKVAIATLDKEWQDKLDAVEMEHEAELLDNIGKAEATSGHLVDLLQRRLSNEHKQNIETLAQEWDEKYINQLEKLRRETEEKYRSTVQETEVDFTEKLQAKEDQYQCDISLLLKERELLVEQAEAGRRNLQAIHQEQMEDLKSMLQTEYEKSESLQAKAKMEDQANLEENNQMKEAHDVAVQEKENILKKLHELEEKLEKQRVLANDDLNELQNKMTKVHQKELMDMKEKYQKKFEENKSAWIKENEQRKGSWNEPEENYRIPAQKRNYTSMMTLVHLSDSEEDEAAPPAPRTSPPKFTQIEAEMKEQVMEKLREEFKEKMDAMKDGMEKEHQKELVQQQIQMDMKYEMDLNSAKDMLNSKRDKLKHDLEQERDEALENLRQKLQDSHQKQLVKLHLESAAETARQVEEVTKQVEGEMKKENASNLKTILEEKDHEHKLEVEQLREDLEHEFQTELGGQQTEFELQKKVEVRKTIADCESKHSKELDEVKKQYEENLNQIRNEAKESIIENTAAMVTELAIEHAQKMESFEQLVNSKEKEDEDWQKVVQGMQDRHDVEIDAMKQNIEDLTNTEGLSEEIERIKNKLKEKTAELKDFRASVEQGTAPEIQDMKEALVDQYDNKLEVLKTTMEEELLELTRTMQEQQVKEMEELQNLLAVNHQQMIDKFVDEQNVAIEEKKKEHENELEELKEQTEYETKIKIDALEKETEQKYVEENMELQREYDGKINKIKKEHARELASIEQEFAEKLKEEKERLEQKMEQQLANVKDIDDALELMKARHAEELIETENRVKDELILSHMEKFRAVTDQLEEEHKNELETVRKEVRNETEKDFMNKFEETLALHQEELNTQEETFKKEREEVRREYEDKLVAMSMGSDEDIERFKLDLEEAHSHELKELQEKLANEKSGDVERLEKQQTEEMEKIKEENRLLVERLKKDYDQRMLELAEELRNRHEEEKEDALSRLEEEHQKEKGELDAHVKETEAKWRLELQQKVKELNENHSQDIIVIGEEIEKLREENNTLLKKAKQYDTLINRRERENEESDNLLAMLRADLNRINGERDNIQQANDHLLRVLSQSIQVTMATEETINHQLAKLLASTEEKMPGSFKQEEEGRGAEGRSAAEGEDSRLGAVGGAPLSPTGGRHHLESPDGMQDTSVGSIYSDEGLELSQQLAESIFAGPDLDAEGEELVLGANGRLQSAVEKLLEMMAATTQQLHQARSMQTELLNATMSSQDELSQMRDRQQELLQQVKEEVEEKERVSRELDSKQGLLDGYTDELSKVQANQNPQLQTLLIKAAELEKERDQIREEKKILEEQQKALAEKIGEEDFGLMEENSRLRQEKLCQEQQAQKDRISTEQQLHLIESQLVEQINKTDSLAEEKKAMKEEFEKQLAALQKQQRSDKQFLGAQANERELEREEFQKEIRRLENELKNRGDKAPSNEHLVKELQDLRDELGDKVDLQQATKERIQQLENDLCWKQETSQELASQLRELEQKLDQQKQTEQESKQQEEEMEKELEKLRQVEDELTNDKDVLQQQLQDSLIKLSRLQSQLEVIKHENLAPSQVESQPAISLAEQLSTEREAGERKQKEIDELVEQLEQFREDIINKDEEIEQLALQLEVVKKEQAAQLNDLKQAEENRRKDDDGNESMPEFAQQLIDEKNLEIDHLTEQFTQAQDHIQFLKEKIGQQELELSKPTTFDTSPAPVEEVLVRSSRDTALGHPPVGAEAPGPAEKDHAEQLGNIKAEFEEMLQERDKEISKLHEALCNEKNRDLLADPTVLKVLEQKKRDNDMIKKQLDNELESLHDLLGVREHEVSQLEMQLARLQGVSRTSGEDLDNLRDQINGLQKDIDSKDMKILQLKLQVDELEEAILQRQQELSHAAVDQLQELQNQHHEELATMEAKHKMELAALREACDAQGERVRQLESDYDRRLTSLQGLSPGKTLQQKLDEIRRELTLQHQDHIHDIQTNMERDATVRINQLKTEHNQQIDELRGKHKRELEQAILQVNRDLMSAHSEEIERLRREYQEQMRQLTSSPISPQTSTELGQKLKVEVDTMERLDRDLLGHLRSRQDGVGKDSESTESGIVDSSSDIPIRLQSLLNRVHSEGLQVLTMSDLRYLRQHTSPRRNVQNGADIASLQESWENEKQALLDAIQALKDLISQTTGQWSSRSYEVDWRGELLKAILYVFDKERETLLAELRTHVVASGDKDLSDVQMLERRIRDQESHHRSALDQIYSADRSSLLAEIQDVHEQNTTLKLELQEQRQKLISQLSNMEEQTTNRERHLKRQAETMEFKIKQEQTLNAELKKKLSEDQNRLSQMSLSSSRSQSDVIMLKNEVADEKMKVDQLKDNCERLEEKVQEITNVAESALCALENEKSRNVGLQESFQREQETRKRMQHALDEEHEMTSDAIQREQDIIKNFRKDLEQERGNLANTSSLLEQEKVKSNGLRQELELERKKTSTKLGSQKGKVSDLQGLLDVEKARSHDLSLAVQRFQALNAKLQESMEEERSTFTDTSIEDKKALNELHMQLSSEKARSLDLKGAIQRLQNTLSSVEEELESERNRGLENVNREKSVIKQLKQNLDTITAQNVSLANQIEKERKCTLQMQQERDKIQASVLSLQEREREKEFQREKERESERLRESERRREREMEQRKQHDIDMEKQLTSQTLRTLEQENEDLHEELKQQEAQKKSIEDDSKRMKQSVSRNINVTDWDMQEAYEMEMNKGIGARHSDNLQSRLELHKVQLETIRQRLQLLAVKQMESLQALQSSAQWSPDLEEDLLSLKRSLAESQAELQQVHAALAIQSEGEPLLSSPTTFRLNERILHQNANLSNFVARLSEEKTELRMSLNKLEQEIWKSRNRQDMIDRQSRQEVEEQIANERAALAQEWYAIREAKSDVARLKSESQSSIRSTEYQQAKLQRLYGKYLRAESFRKALTYQKKYLLLLLGGFQDCEQATLALIAKMGAFPSPDDVQRRSRHSRAFMRFRSAVRVVIAVQRLKFLVKKWKRATKVGSPVMTGTTSSSYGSGSRSSPRSGFRTHGDASSPYRSGDFASPVRRSLDRDFTEASPPVREGSDRSVYSLPRHPVGESAPPSGLLYAAAGDPETSLTNYIRRLETLQDRLEVRQEATGGLPSSPLYTFPSSR